MLTVILAHASNPDIDGGYWSAPVDGKKKQSVPVPSLAEASKQCRDFIDRNGLGSGNWIGGEVFDGKKHIANISFNGRVWGIDGNELA